MARVSAIAKLSQWTLTLVGHPREVPCLNTYGSGKPQARIGRSSQRLALEQLGLLSQQKRLARPRHRRIKTHTPRPGFQTAEPGAPALASSRRLAFPGRGGRDRRRGHDISCPYAEIEEDAELEPLAPHLMKKSRQDAGD